LATEAFTLEKFDGVAMEEVAPQLLLAIVRELLV
jgi:hypothetical protein